MEDNSSRNVLAISATVIALGALAYLMTEKEAMVEKFVPLPSVVAYEEPKVADLPALTDEFVSQVSAESCRGKATCTERLLVSGKASFKVAIKAEYSLFKSGLTPR